MTISDLTRRALIAVGALSLTTPSFAQGAPVTDKPTAFTYTSNGLSVAALKIGSGSPLVIVHGLGGHKEDFVPVMVGLSGQHTVYAFDMIGFGGSARTSPTISIGLQVEALHALVVSEKLPKIRLVGNSLGAWIAASFAAKYPELVERVVLIDAAGLKVTLGGPPPVNFAPDTVAEMQNLLQHVIASPFAQTTEFATQALAGFKASGEAATLGLLFAGFAAGNTGDRLLDDVLPQVKAPALVVWGAEDKLFPAALADIVLAGLPAGTRKILIPGASHFPQIDKPAELTAILADFLKP
ncbi:MAG: alpha/beta hydrolase [Alphaproteobacteria bacterium]